MRQLLTEPLLFVYMFKVTMLILLVRASSVLHKVEGTLAARALICDWLLRAAT